MPSMLRAVHRNECVLHLVTRGAEVTHPVAGALSAAQRYADRHVEELRPDCSTAMFHHRALSAWSSFCNGPN